MASGYLIATRFELLYDAALRSGRYDNNPNRTEPIYGVPHKSRAILPPNFPRYRGINRDPLRALSYEQLETSGYQIPRCHFSPNIYGYGTYIASISPAASFGNMPNSTPSRSQAFWPFSAAASGQVKYAGNKNIIVRG